MSGLKPCPFCGGEAELHPTYDMDTNEVDGWFAWCAMGNDCAIKPQTDAYLTEAEAIAAWNTRAAMEFDNWFYLPKPREPIVEVTETMHTWDGTKVKTDVYYQIQEQAIVAWARELDEHITKRICEVWNPERTCNRVVCGEVTNWYGCSECHEPIDVSDLYCRSCGAKVIA